MRSSEAPETARAREIAQAFSRHESVPPTGRTSFHDMVHGYGPRMTGQTVTVTVEISASPAQVWHALTDPELIREYFVGTQVETTWEPGSPITWSGEYDGRSYEDKGEVVEVEPDKRLVVTHFSPLSGQDDVPENHHRITYELADEGDRTRLTLEQDNTPPGSEDEFRSTWESMLGNLQRVVERG
jgi:uncharacterized protein YndB with AHSA1/START domain